jgi:hypothetical protein
MSPSSLLDANKKALTFSMLDRSMAAAAAQGSLRFHCGNRRAVEAGLISVDDAGLGMRWIAESLAEQAFGRRGVAQRRQQEVDGGIRER